MIAGCINRLLGFIIITLLVAGCQPKVYLMPTPVGHQPSTPLYYLREDNFDDNLLYTLYATNRIPYRKPKKGTGYTIFPSDRLELGFVVHSVGDEKTTWDDLLSQSLDPDREEKLLLRQVHARSIVRYRDDDDSKKSPARAEGYFDQINRALAKRFDGDLLVYVHGANSNFYRATAQGAQLYHYSGHNSLVLTFSWPSAENILKYRTDVRHAKKTVPVFARLLELLARHTRAKNINILVYSAGAQIVAPALAYFRDLYPDLTAEELKNYLRIGEVYFAAPDTDFRPSVHNYLQFRDIVERTTINFNENDKVLRLAAFRNRRSRLGRPDVSELTEEEGQMMVSAMNSPRLNILDVGRSQGLALGGAHNFWYSHPWVSNDLLLLFLFKAGPVERGLEPYYLDNGAKVYRFPSDYDYKIKQILVEKREALIEVIQAGIKVKQ